MRRADRVRSPCVSVCALDENDVCIGCHRTGDEILRWTQMTDEERRSVLKQVAIREQKVAL
ncbi:DUF1289 domain-containing protein [Marinobacter daepoensis]|uniref:DUF1289 domain-containing protein n=1 Tax=Marinobacter daepoensis TaxID=262077 RepID=A0ABS3BE58_9GAMM|nr:DUF1289 domain-containing protein [Marinobacter daepoensis]MBN7770118.1 DUF1289 domain-containing protein [Marinobacter daepoensis]MBY6034841.1 DUF1289 domain-containing protein [Marinobacter daepoensis]MBY6080832.1 DUF1289 domain-containing protein [Marinobacter daepoensis]